MICDFDKGTEAQTSYLHTPWGNENLRRDNEGGLREGQPSLCCPRFPEGTFSGSSQDKHMDGAWLRSRPKIILTGLGLGTISLFGSVFLCILLDSTILSHV